MRSKSKTSVEILEERDALQQRVLELELALVKVGEEIEHALRHPEAQHLTLCRIGTVVRRATPNPTGASEDEFASPPISKTRPTVPSKSTRECA